ncbi:unnamed protein product [Arctia plantaginis]|uniref:Calbindin-32 n=1 Tax=Arctia plantaginis TaxID=874455 RepID=A0A8S1ASP1_ARCPL|nr:unnamed protein product [Arctia plantaginis]
MSIDSNSSAKRFNLERASNFMRQFRDPDSRELKKLSANQFMEVWSHYDRDGKFLYIFLRHTVFRNSIPLYKFFL